VQDTQRCQLINKVVQAIRLGMEAKGKRPSDKSR
jgi:hypothetical protein